MSTHIPLYLWVLIVQLGIVSGRDYWVSSTGSFEDLHVIILPEGSREVSCFSQFTTPIFDRQHDLARFRQAENFHMVQIISYAPTILCENKICEILNM